MGTAETETYLATVPEPTRATLAALCAVIRAADPRLRDEIKWNAPSFALTDHLATTGVNRDGSVRLVLHTGAEKRANPHPIVVDDGRGIFERKGPDRLVATLASEAEIAELADELERVLRAWIAQAEIIQEG
ncbi:DUF1801 domain-containing protein [uncultured Schumannella sp.]|uniref:DUF1801 domain-containing protein n=1 Tax=uncultured Schumannella sp. TaxID=1195956 RepID=UPI0025FD3BED|nr:DUF1801 domain-containing protein [uncultured Schumannella sp.]